MRKGSSPGSSQGLDARRLEYTPRQNPGLLTWGSDRGLAWGFVRRLRGGLEYNSDALLRTKVGRFRLSVQLLAFEL